MNINDILHLSTYAGKIMLENGAEAYRVEETMNKISEAFGVEKPDSYATPTAIISSASHKGETKSVVVRILKRSVNLEKIHRVNDLARNIKNNNYTVEEFKEKLKEIDNEKRYSNKVTILFSAIGALSFTFLFGGGLKDAAAAFFIGLIVKFFDIEADKIGLNSFFSTIICSAITAFLAILSIKLNIAADIDKVIIGSIMLLVPGLAITNAIRDTIAGDLISGIARAVEAFLIAIGVAAGTGVVLSFWINTFGGL
ncbi:threonine/serine exporter family protein [Caproiciproducens sp. MSJ-32]|uniref:threonine/serine exporter family protein n=1 Tax=Caproiciproducens sp. MSJ-32 TaxID=2841527 RepID=UPI001C1122DC|nr:threonine/serine exporter family protein [Caproiciproducens sp. MSJ-32]MBU5454824.1 threonine/serine exporter family protein [Caproiciproducens sp. MSJ-32]